MVPSILKFLCCPSCRSERRLAVTEDILPVLSRPVKSALTHIWEGTLKCETCGIVFPIIHGLPILVKHYDDYIARRKHEFIAIVAQYGSSVRCKELIFDIPESIYGPANKQESWESRQGLDIYIQNHYADSNIEPKDELYSPISPEHSFYDYVANELMKRMKHGYFLDIGCSVGGFLHRISSSAEQAIGIEYSFAAAVTARDILSIEGPESIEYKYYEDSYKGKTLTLRGKKRENVSIIVADAASLPLKQSLIDYALLSNVLDISEDPGLIFSELARTVKTGGLICTVSPYYWRPDRSPPSKWLTATDHNSATGMKLLIGKYGLSPYFEHDGIPWVLRFYNRYYQIWMCHMLISRNESISEDSCAVQQ